jgi:hypothetical protein
MKAYIAAGLLVLLAACSSAQPPTISLPSATVISVPQASGTPSRIEVVNRGVAALGQTLTELYRAAQLYTDLPRCGTGPRICSDRETVRQIRRAAIRAHNSYVAARNNEAMVEPAWNALNVFRAVIPGI